MKPGMVATCVGDITKLDNLKRMIEETIKFGWKVDILVNNAGIGRGGTVMDVDDG